jgi:hypothetical protein
LLSSLVWQLLLYCCFTAALLLLYCCFTAALLLLVVVPAATWLKWLASRSFLFFSYSESPVSISYRHTGHEFVACSNMNQGFFCFLKAVKQGALERERPLLYCF